MKLRTLNVTMEEATNIGNLKIEANCRYVIKAEHEKNTNWILDLKIISFGTKMHKLGDVWLPLPHVKAYQLNIVNPFATVSANEIVGTESEFHYTTEIDKTLVLVEDNDVYNFTGKLRPFSALIESNMISHSII